MFFSDIIFSGIRPGMLFGIPSDILSGRYSDFICHSFWHFILDWVPARPTELATSQCRRQKLANKLAILLQWLVAGLPSLVPSFFAGPSN
jgi:hypothetical protein